MTDIPDELKALARDVAGRSYESAKRLVVSKVGSVRRGERFDDDVADAVFLRLQRNAQVGRYASEEVLRGLGRNARRLEGEGDIELYRSAPPGAGIRPGDFVAGTAHEVGFYAHGGNVVHRMTVAREDVFGLDGSMGGGREYVYLPAGYVAPVPVEHFATFRAFYEAARTPEPDAAMAP